MSHFPAFVGREFGQFREEGLDVQLVRVTGNVVVAAAGNLRHDDLVIAKLVRFLRERDLERSVRSGLQKLLDDEIAYWTPVIRAIGLKLD